ncbi:MAG: CoA-binding protein [Saprospiraceae bacterium]|nr:CoA-binding protein [Saprospiraceae bacterium]
MSETKKTIVLGASTNPERSVYKAIFHLKNAGHEIILIGKTPGEVHGVPIQTDRSLHKDVDTITLYLNSKHQEQWYSYILALQPRRLIFNPGAENSELSNLANQHGIQTEEACTMVLVQTGQY